VYPRVEEPSAWHHPASTVRGMQDRSQQRARRDEPVGAQPSWQQPGQRGQDGPVGPVRLRPGDLPPDYRDLMTEHHDLRILGRLAAPQQEQPAKHPDHDQIEQAKRHKPRSCANLLIRPNRRSQPLCRVLKRYRCLVAATPPQPGPLVQSSHYEPLCLVAVARRSAAAAGLWSAAS